jgi:DNA-binding response OmpR family regulator
MKNVFLLEDNDMLRELFTYLLEEENLQVTSYCNVESFRKGIADALPDIFIMDIWLPDGNGMDVCRETKSNIRTRDIPVILLSADMEDKELSEQCGAQDFIPKPFDINDFISRVKGYLN